MRYIAKNNISAVASTDANYPPLLRECVDFPHVLYVKGNVEALAAERTISMVGTRTITPYGQRMSDKLVSELARLEPKATVVSGLAFGVDIACHRAAMKYGLRTVAVIANPLPDVTPAQHAAYAEEIVASGGAIISEYNSQSKPSAGLFLERNRIIAGISAGTVVVESPLKGGSLATAALAESYNRQVFGVPGRIGDRCSEGVNSLIRNRKAQMICRANDIIEELGWNIEKIGFVPEPQPSRPDIGPDEAIVLAAMDDSGAIGIDALGERCRMEMSRISALLFSLEMADLVRSLPGKMYEKV